VVVFTLTISDQPDMLATQTTLTAIPVFGGCIAPEFTGFTADAINFQTVHAGVYVGVVGGFESRNSVIQFLLGGGGGRHLSLLQILDMKRWLVLRDREFNFF